MKSRFFLAIVMGLCLHACSANRDKPVRIRIQNATQQSFASSTIAAVNFGPLAPGTTTSYQSFDELMLYSGVTVVTGEDTVYIGNFICGTPPIPMFEPGTYRMEITLDSTSFTGYHSTCIKE